MTKDSTYQKVWLRFRRNRTALLGLWVIVLSVITAVFGYWFAPDNSTNANVQMPELGLKSPGFRAHFLKIPTNQSDSGDGPFQVLWRGKSASFRYIPIEQSSMQQRGDTLYFKRPGTRAGEENYVLPAGSQAEQYLTTRTFWLGTDRYGRCILSRLLLGFRVSLLVGLIAVLISLTIGLVAGAASGYFGGRVDDLILLIINTMWSIPTLLLVFAIVLALGRGIGIIFIAVGLTMWVDVARLVRGQVIALREMPFVEAAKSMGVGSGRILLRHILPNLLGPVLVVTAGNFATAILLESGLSYLGFGVQPPAPSWGNMLNENYGYAISGRPFLALSPAIVIALIVLAFNTVGNGLRDALDVRRQD